MMVSVSQRSARCKEEIKTIIYQDRRILAAEKPCGVLSTDEPGGMPELLRQELHEPHGCVLTVHRLDRAVSGLMVFARSHRAAALLSEQIRSGVFQKEYLAVVRGCPAQPEGTLTDHLIRDRGRRTTRIADESDPQAQEARLHYVVLDEHAGYALLRIRLLTGRTHQIRVQFSGRGMPLLGDRKYGCGEDCPIGLWSWSLSFLHPQTGEAMTLRRLPPQAAPWTPFSDALARLP